MGTQMSPGDIMSSRIWASLNDQASVNTINHEVLSTSGSSATDQDLANAMSVMVAGFYKNIMTVDCQYHGVQTYFQYAPSAFYPAYVKSVGLAGPGLQAAPVLPGNCAAIMAYQTNVRGPGGRGRLYLPFVATALVTSDGLQAISLVTATNTLVSNLVPLLVVIGSGGTATLAWSLVHRQKRPLPDLARGIKQGASTGKFGQMHKRGDYGRPNSSPI